MTRRSRRQRVPTATREPEIKSESRAQTFITTINKTHDLVKALAALAGFLTVLVTVTGFAALAIRSDLSASQVTELIRTYCTK